MAESSEQTATAEELAALFDTTEMQAFSLEECPVPAQSEWPQIGMEHLPHLRLAWVTMCKTKPELLELVQSLFGDESDPEPVIGLSDRFQATQDYFKALADLASAAQARIMMAAAKLVIAEPSDPAVHGDV